ncbi:MAG: 1-acyl-sn-glycerol-3-phosphate acyltransferase [Rhodothermia bacterium]|nr:1-acyl-sn-glycerol-3-phosphate acyltransferase [Rhodothermia bacterium]
MPASSASKFASIALFRTLLLSFVRVYWRPFMAEGSREMPEGPCFLYGNHSNRWDPFVLNCFTPWARPTAGVMTREFFRKPFLRWALGSLDLQPTRKRIAEPGLVRAVKELLDRGEKVVIYPEGGSRWAGRPEPWIESTAKIFMRFGYPVYPVIMHGSYVTWPRWATYPRPGRIRVEVLPAIQFEEGGGVAEALQKLKAPIRMDENVVEDDLRPSWAHKPAHGIQKLLYRDPVTRKYKGLVSRDGTMVINLDRSLRLTMLPDSRLLNDTTGEIQTTADLYEQIRAVPFEPDSEGVYLRDVAEVSMEKDFPRLSKPRLMSVKLTGDSVLLGNGRDMEVVALERVQAIDIERNYKLQLALADKMVQIAFTGQGSALAWMNALSQFSVASTPAP